MAIQGDVEVESSNFVENREVGNGQRIRLDFPSVLMFISLLNF